MSVYSMTGYASAVVMVAAQRDSAAGAASTTVEMRSVNSRFLDLVLRLPDEHRGLEPALRERLSRALRRGKVELRLSTSRDEAPALAPPAPEQLLRLARVETQVQAWLPKAAPLSVHEALQWCRTGGAPAAADDAVLAAADTAIADLRAARKREGARLAETLRERVAKLRALVAQAAPLVPAIVQRQQQRFVERWTEALQTVGAAGVSEDALRERALAEAAAYALRIDVAEELSRLGAHLDEVTRLLDHGGEVGKRLDFLMQELQREANTLGSKSAALELTAIAVEMKVAIEQMREQVQNLE